MIALTLAEVAAVTGGRFHGITAEDAAGLVLDGPVVTDSREAGPGSLYIARVGEHLDGHAFVAGAAEAGAVAALTSRDVDELPCVVVGDVQEAFAALSRAVAARGVDLTIVGITGSSGKTSTKDLLGSVLADLGETVAPVGSYNSEVGVPLTVTRITEDTRFLVVEMGARGVGHIRYLTTMAPPRIGVVLNVGSAHIGEFGSKEAIAVAKAELVEALPADGVAVLNADDPIVRAMAAATRARVVLVGEAPDARRARRGRRPRRRRAPDLRPRRRGGDRAGDPRASSVATTSATPSPSRPSPSSAACRSRPSPRPSAAARPVSRWRMEITDRPDGVRVVNDAYNANPDSMVAALEALRVMSGGGRRSVAVLGTMLELGEESRRGHTEVGRVAAALGVDRLVVVGEEARPMCDGAAGSDTTCTWVAGRRRGIRRPGRRSARG